MTFIKTSMSAAGSKEAIANAKVKGHGIVAKGADGKLVATIDGHSYGKSKVEKVVKKLLGNKAPKAVGSAPKN